MCGDCFVHGLLGESQDTNPKPIRHKNTKNTMLYGLYDTPKIIRNSPFDASEPEIFPASQGRTVADHELEHRLRQLHCGPQRTGEIDRCVATRSQDPSGIEKKGDIKR